MNWDSVVSRVIVPCSPDKILKKMKVLIDEWMISKKLKILINEWVFVSILQHNVHDDCASVASCQVIEDG